MEPLNTFPRPDFARSRWQSLDGTWQFAFSDEVSVSEAELAIGRGYDRSIQVPFCYQCAQSGIGDKTYHECVWYARTLFLTIDQCAGSVLLNFGAVDYEARLYVNGQFVGAHSGGFAQFGFDIAPYAMPGENTIVLCVHDDRAVDRPRGKQSWLEQPDRCWYTPTTGIWRSVWVEFTAKQHITELRLLPDIDRRCVVTDLRFSAPVSGQLTVRIRWKERLCKELALRVEEASYLHECFTLAPEDAVDDLHLWSPQSPSLYEISFTLSSENSVLDEVSSYFGMRKIEVNGDTIRLNYQPLYQRLILDQGYWSRSLMTPPDEEALVRDLTLIRKMGFNGLRMHQKNEDPRLLYHADRLGLLVWLEMPSAYACTTRSVRSVLSEWDEIVRQNWNHPSIIAYVPFNESWGVRDIRADAMQRSLADCAYHLTRALDPTRLVSTNDGWEFPENTDFYGFHSYFPDADTFRAQFSDWSRRAAEGMVNRPLALDGQPLTCRPVLLTEFGGIAMKPTVGAVSTQFGGSGDWGYNAAAANTDELTARLRAQIDAVLDTDYLCGYCYTQLTDVEQEINGLLTPERVPKLPISVLREIFSRDPIGYRK